MSLLVGDSLEWCLSDLGGSVDSNLVAVGKGGYDFWRS